MSADPHHRPSSHKDTLLRLLIDGTMAGTGIEFFRPLVRNLAKALGTSGAWVTEYDPATRSLRAFAMWLDGAFVDDYQYPIDGTACCDVIESRRVVHIPERLIDLYPNDLDLAPAGAVSYLGTVLTDPDGAIIGHLAVLDRHPMPADPKAISLFEVFAARAAGELRRLRAEREVRAREEELALLIETAPDAIIVIDHSTQIVRSNPAAQRLLAAADDTLHGRTILSFFAPQDAPRIQSLLQQISTRPHDTPHLWVPGDFVLRRDDDSVFPAEITLSRFERQGCEYFTLSLRNCDDRLEAEREIQRLSRETEILREAVRDLPGFGELLGRSPGMRTVFDAIRQVARTDATVLITGETGTGKELVARSIHQHSARAPHPLVTVNCAALPAALIESECFGHERGAFTGAVSRRDGRFALADGGTLFLDEIGEMPLELQSKLLRVLQEGTFEPLGSARTIKVNVRVIAATHRDLQRMVADGRFREDLYFRLNVFPIHVPPLRERGDDISFLATTLTSRLARRMGKSVDPPTPDDLARLTHHPWPGNVRELQNVLERALILASSRHLPIARALTGTHPDPPPPPGEPAPPSRILTAAELRQFEYANLQAALDACRGRVAGPDGAAALLGVPPSTFSSRLKALGGNRHA